MAKDIQRSIRFSKQIFDYVDGYRGTGFSDKFENMVIDAMEGEARRNAILADLDRQIEEASDRLRFASIRLSELDRIATRVKSVSDTVDKLVVVVDSVLMGGV